MEEAREEEKREGRGGQVRRQVHGGGGETNGLGCASSGGRCRSGVARTCAGYLRRMYEERALSRAESGGQANPGSTGQMSADSRKCRLRSTRHVDHRHRAVHGCHGGVVELPRRAAVRVATTRRHLDQAETCK